MNQSDYIRLSLELHLFFDRTMKEHSFFLESSFTDKDKNLKIVANNFQKRFTMILENIVRLADGNISKEFILADEIVTKHTLDAENKTSNLSGIAIHTNITKNEIRLREGTINFNRQLFNEISNLNQMTLPVIKNLIEFKNDILNKVLSCKMYTTNYPLWIVHMMNEAKIYYHLLSKVERKEKINENDMYEQELFWNNIMKEHAEFIRGLLDPSERTFLLTADKYAGNYEKIMQNHSNHFSNLTNASLDETVRFRDFKVTTEEGILNCKMKSIIIPLLADHIVREANHFIRILKNVNQILS